MSNIKNCQYFDIMNGTCEYSTDVKQCNYGDNYERPADCPDPAKDKCTGCAVESLCVKECGE